jgi:hypothetical protein
MGLGAAILLAAGCNKVADQSNVAAADNGLVENETAMADNAAADEGAPVAVAPVPAPAADVPAADAAPLQQAAIAAAQIESATDVERIPYQGGWAWRRDGQIIRTASRDGRVSYFRPGDSDPYLVQANGRAFAYANGRVARSYDTHGRPAQPDTKQRDEGQRLARVSAQERDQARQVAARQPQRVQPERPQPPAGRAHDDRPGNGQAADHGKDGHDMATPDNRMSGDAGRHRQTGRDDRGGNGDQR